MSKNNTIVVENDFSNTVQNVLRDVYDTVLSTFGPLGSLVLLEDGSSRPHITKDGVTVANALNYPDKLSNLIISVLRESSQKINNEVGDGTTTAMLLSYYMLSLLHEVEDSDSNIPLIISILKQVIDVVQQKTTMIDMTSPILSDIINVSSNNDALLIKTLNKIRMEIGSHGVIDVIADEAINTLTYDISKGALINSRATSGYFVNSSTDREYFSVLLIEGKINNVRIFSDMLNRISVDDDAVGLVIIAEEYSLEVIEAVSRNNASQRTNILLLLAEGFSNSRFVILKDIQLLTGGDIASTNGVTNIDLYTIKAEHLGSIRSVTPYMHGFVFGFDPNILKDENIVSRVTSLRESYTNLHGQTSSSANARRAIINHSLRKFVSIATIKVGGSTNAEMIEFKDRVDDAVHAVYSAVSHGIIPGGGITLLHAVKEVMQKKENQNVVTNDLFTRFGEGLIVQLAVNSITSTTTILKKLNKDNLIMFDVLANSYTTIEESHIFDPSLALIRSLEVVISLIKTLYKTRSAVLLTE